MSHTLSDTFSQSIKMFDQIDSDLGHGQHKKKSVTKFLMLFSTFLTVVLFFMVMYNKSGSGGFKQLYKKLNK